MTRAVVFFCLNRGYLYTQLNCPCINSATLTETYNLNISITGLTWLSFPPPLHSNMGFKVSRLVYQIMDLLIMLGTVLLVDKTYPSFYVESVADTTVLALGSPVLISSEDADQWERAKGEGGPFNLLWTFRANSSHRIHFTFQSFDFPPGFKMNIGEGLSNEADKIIVNFSGTYNTDLENLPSNVTSLTNYTWMQVTLKPSVMDKPVLQVTVQAVETQESILQGGSTMPIKSPLYPDAYVNNGYCLWDIRTANGSSIEVEVLVFNMEQDKDYLHIGDGYQRFTKFANTKSWKHWTGNMEDSRQNLNFCSVSSRLQMIFTSDETGTRVGFHILLRAVDTTTTQRSVTTVRTPGISTTHQESPSQSQGTTAEVSPSHEGNLSEGASAEITPTHQDITSQVFSTTISTTPGQFLIKRDKFFIWFLIGLASLLALILLMILLRWLYKKYLKRWINRHFNSKYYVVTRNSTEHSQSMGDPDNVYEEIPDDLTKPRLKINNSRDPHNAVNGADLPLAEISRPSTAKVQVHPPEISASHRFLDVPLATSSICAKTFEVDRQEGFNDSMDPAAVKTESSVRASMEAEMAMGMPDHQSNTDNSLSSRAASQMSMRSTFEEDTKLSGCREVESDGISLTLSRIYFERTASADDVFDSTSCEAAENREGSLDEKESNSLWNVSNCSSEEGEHFDLKHAKIYDIPPSRFEKQGGSLDRSESPIPAKTRNPISSPTESPRTVKTLPPSFGSQSDRYVNVRNCVSAISSDIGCDKFNSLNVNNSNSTESGGVLLDEFGYLIIEDNDIETFTAESQSSAIFKNSRKSPSRDYPERTLNDEEVDVNIDEFGYVILEK